MNTSPNLNLNLPELTDTADITPITANFSTIDAFAGNVYVKTEVDTFLASKADKATTLAGYGITDAYTKSEADTLLGAKADQATTYSKTEVQTYVSNVLDGYLPMVRTTGNQAISGVKDFTAQLMVTGIWDNKVSQNLESTSIWRRIYYTTTTSLSNQVLTLLVTPQKGNNDEAGIIVFYATTAGVSARWLVKGRGAVNDNYCIVKTSGGLYEIWAKNYDGNRGLSFMRLTETNWGSTTNNWTRDLTTKNDNFDPTTYAAYAYPTEDGLAHTYGNETIAGVKTFTDILIKKSSGVDMSATPSAQQTAAQMDFQDKNGTAIVRFRTYHETNGNSELSLILPQQGWNGLADYQQPRLRFITGAVSGQCSLTLSKASNSYIPSASEQIATIGILDAYTPMVRTTGTQNIGGMKLFTVTPACLHASVANTSGYKRIFRSKSGTVETVTNVIFGRVFARNNNTLVNWVATFRRGSTGYRPAIDVDKVCGLSIALTTDGYIEIWCTNSRFNCIIDAYLADNNATFKDAVADFDNTITISDTGPQEDGVNYTYVTPENITGA